MRTFGCILFLIVGWTLLAAGCADDTHRESDMSLSDFFPNEIDGWPRTEPMEAYDRQTIFDYINGAGEVYNSYAFKKVAAADYTRDGAGGFRVELFDMGKPEDAFGVFSYAREDEQAGIGGGCELRGAVLSFWQDRFYVSIVANWSGDDTAEILLTAARTISARLPSTNRRPDILDQLPDENMVAHSQRFFHLHTALNYHNYLRRENVLMLSAETDAVLARYEPSPLSLLLIRYSSEEDAVAALASFASAATELAENKCQGYDRVGAYVVVALDGPTPAEGRALLVTAKHKLETDTK